MRGLVGQELCQRNGYAVQPGYCGLDAAGPRGHRTPACCFMVKRCLRSRLKMARCVLVEASNWEIEERGQWLYRADFSTPEGTYNRTLSASRILHPRIGATPKRPWQGESPIPSATAKLAARARNEADSGSGRACWECFLPLPHKGSA